MPLQQFNFAQYKQTLCTAFQTADFNVAIKKGKDLFLETFDEYLPFPIQEHLEEYTAFMNLLTTKIEEENSTILQLISKSEAKAKYKITDKFFERFYPEPESLYLIPAAKTNFGKKVYCQLFNENKIIQIFDSEPYQVFLEAKKATKNSFLNI